jgi:hypothetical protein
MMQWLLITITSKELKAKLNSLRVLNNLVNWWRNNVRINWKKTNRIRLKILALAKSIGSDFSAETKENKVNVKASLDKTSHFKIEFINKIK